MGHTLPFRRDHPHIRSPQGVMSCDEIRFWITQLLEQGWRPTALAHVVGIHTGNNCASHLRRKLTGSWIYPGEQIRFSNGLKRILAGELVCVHLGGRNGNSWGAVVASNPVPLRLPTRLRYNLGAGRLEYAPTVLECKPTLPSFRDVFTKADVWAGRAR